MNGYRFIPFLETSGTEVIFLFLALLGATFGKIYPPFFRCKAISLLLPFFCIFLVLTLKLHFSPVSFFLSVFSYFKLISGVILPPWILSKFCLEQFHFKRNMEEKLFLLFLLLLFFFVSHLSSPAGSLHVPSNERY